MTAVGTPPVVIVHRNQPDRCVATVRQFSTQSTAVQVVVVDNASAPADVERLVRGIGDTTLIRLEDNRGFGPAANVGLRRWLGDDDGSEWAFVAPHDAVLGPDTVGKLLDAGGAERSAGILCADVGDQARPMIDRFFGALPGRALSYEGYEPVDYPHGTLLAIRRGCAAEIGIFDPRYFAYGEEADLGLRASAAGWQVGLVRNAMVANPTTSGSGSIVDYLKHRNTLLLLREHAGRWPVALRTAVLAGQALMGTLAPSRRPPWFDASARRRALVDFARGRTGPPPADL